MPEVSLPQGTIRLRETKGPNPPIVFVHGFLVDSRLWGPVQDRLEALGVASIAPDLPLGSHTLPLAEGADRSPRGIARLIIDLLEALDLHGVTLVGNDTGGALCQFVLDTDATRVGRLLLTNCDAFDEFPPKPFDLGARVATLPGVMLPALQAMRSGAMRDSALGFGVLTERPIPRAVTRAWVQPCLSDRAVRRDTLAFLRAVDADDLLDVSTRLHRFDRPVLLCWAPADRFFRIEQAHRLLAAFPDARLVQIPDSRTFVSLDQPDRLTEELLAFAGVQAGSSAASMAPAGM